MSSTLFTGQGIEKDRDGEGSTSKDKFGGNGRSGSSNKKVGDKSTPTICARGRASAISLAQIPLPQPTSRILGAGWGIGVRTLLFQSSRMPQWMVFERWISVSPYVNSF